VHPRYHVPHRAELTVAAVVVVLVLLADLRGVIGFSSFGVLLYYAIANLSAWTLDAERPARRVLPAAGLIGCVVLALTLPWPSIAIGSGVLAIGLLARVVVLAVRRRDAGARS